MITKRGGIPGARTQFSFLEIDEVKVASGRPGHVPTTEQIEQLSGVIS